MLREGSTDIDRNMYMVMEAQQRTEYLARAHLELQLTPLRYIRQEAYRHRCSRVG